jgi:hypothetical protein
MALESYQIASLATKTVNGIQVQAWYHAPSNATGAPIQHVSRELHS